MGHPQRYATASYFVRTPLYFNISMECGLIQQFYNEGGIIRVSCRIFRRVVLMICVRKVSCTDFGVR